MARNSWRVKRSLAKGMNGEALRDNPFAEDLHVRPQLTEKPMQYHEEVYPMIVRPDMQRGRPWKKIPDVLRVEAFQIALETRFHLPPDLWKRLPLDCEVQL